MKPSFTSSLVISTYNWPEALSLVLKSVNNQKILPDEIIIADDGSSDETKDVIEMFKGKLKSPLIHVWHKDEGFRKSVILNKAIAIAKGDYIIQADGDCILHPLFVKDHLSLAEASVYLYGSRVNIQKHYLKTLFENKKIRFGVFSKGIKKRTRTIRIPLLSFLYKKSTKFSKKYRGCNTSFFRKDFIAVNGYNEDFKGWGREDSELALRLHNFGIKARRLRYKGILYHIYHNEKSKDRLEINNEIEQNTITNKVTWCKNGIESYLNEE
ncbi:glycosyltransferase family 2 protein [Winogradskyella immobilis]|uniref:Glycosyltransferase family 2 protein n=1 Tax=Winogradskyella immobilis TaxID=2816852 RepID=A0ABS8EPU7_9FLAO|nr:glycosyltransferase family 2 protein [Winogradskyella immobilis]MCC1485253.1 glycosyltransferase family 2 protein [Winogradskyella immobilis]MCG0017345.1 glycosyltransferase family 2 protein [Winogradskyella immobilis]